MILDTTFLIDIMEQDVSAVDKLNSLIKKGEPQLVTALTLFELYSGVTRCSQPDQEKQKILLALRGQVIVHLDADAAERAGEIDGELAKKGLMVSPIDCLIGGISIIKKEKVLTRNVKDFSKMKGVQVESY